MALGGEKWEEEDFGNSPALYGSWFPHVLMEADNPACLPALARIWGEELISLGQVQGQGGKDGEALPVPMFGLYPLDVGGEVTPVVGSGGFRARDRVCTPQRDRTFGNPDLVWRQGCSEEGLPAFQSSLAGQCVIPSGESWELGGKPFAALTHPPALTNKDGDT